MPQGDCPTHFWSACRQCVVGGPTKTELWPSAPGHSQNRTRQSFQQHQAGSDARGSTSRVPQLPAIVVRERKTLEQVRSDVSTSERR